MFDPSVKKEIINRIHNLTPDIKSKWGKMNVGQMLTHVQLPINYAFGKHEIKGGGLLRLIGPLFKSVLYNEKPYKQNLPTDKSYVVTDEREFEKEKQQLLELINQFNEQSIHEKPHPIFGKLTKKQWSLATWKHLDHHLRQFGV